MKAISNSENDEHMNVLHCFESYLNITENWLYRIIKCQRVNRFIASEKFIDGKFYLKEVMVLESPLQTIARSVFAVPGTRRILRILAASTYMNCVMFSLRNKKIDIVHSHFAQVGWRYRDLARWLGAKHVVSFYGWDYVRLATADPKWGPRLERLYAEADCFLCEGPYGAALLARNGCPKGKIRIARLGVELDRIPVFHRSKQSGTLQLLQLASFREKKGHIDTIQAFARALQQCPDMHLTLIGAGPGDVYDQVQTAICTLGIANKVTLRGGVSFDELHETMRPFHVFIHPSRHARDGDCEGGAPVVLLDAQATGMPVIATSHCDISQEVVDGISGMLCGEGDVDGLARAITKFCNMGDNEYAAYASAARRHVEQGFDVRVCAAHVEQIYRELTSNSKPS